MADFQRGQDFIKTLPSLRQDLPYSLTLLQDLFDMTGERSTATLERVGQTINKDQGIAAKVLALANSAFYGFQARVASVTRALSLLGFKEVRNLILLLGAQALTVKYPLPSEFDLKGYWEHQLGAGVCAKMLGQRLNAPNPDILFTIGLLHDFGALLTALYRPDDWTAIYARMREKGIPLSQAEEEHWSVTHSVIGSLTLASWNLPSELTEPIRWHHDPFQAREFGLEAEIVCLAESIDNRRRFPGVYELTPQARRVLVERQIIEKEILVELAWVLEDESLAQFVAHLT
jgi:HD-like signal output (HDOD) protein